MENSNHKSIKSESLDYRKSLNSDLIMLGCISAVNFYILLVAGIKTDGIDVFLKSLSLFQAIGISFSAITIMALIELYVRSINKSKSAFLISRFLLGVITMVTAYILVIVTGGSSGYDNIIRDLTSWDILNLLTIEFMFFCFTVAFEKVENKRCQNKSSDEVSRQE